jgi:hypothetical protein
MVVVVGPHGTVYLETEHPQLQTSPQGLFEVALQNCMQNGLHHDPAPGDRGEVSEG